MGDQWAFFPGKNQILLTAPHNYPHYREGKIKVRDINTGKIVQKLCRLYDCYGMWTIARQVDPNWYRDSSFRKEVFRVAKENKLKAVVDIHGSSLENKELIKFIPNKTFKEKFGDCLKNLVVSRFLNDKQVTITEDLDGINVAGCEVEIRKDGRVKKMAPENFDKAFNLLKVLLGQIISY